MNLQNRTIAVIGLGYVGLPLGRARADCHALRARNDGPVIGFDIKASRIAELQAGHDHTLEVSEDELREAKHLTFTSDSSSLRGARQGDVAIQPAQIATPALRSRNDGNSLK